MNTGHDLILQISSGMRLRTKRSKFRVAEQRTKELYDRFKHNQMTAQELLSGLSFFLLRMKNEIKFNLL